MERYIIWKGAKQLTNSPIYANAPDRHTRYTHTHTYTPIAVCAVWMNTHIDSWQSRAFERRRRLSSFLLFFILLLLLLLLVLFKKKSKIKESMYCAAASFLCCIDIPLILLHVLHLFALSWVSSPIPLGLFFYTPSVSLQREGNYTWLTSLHASQVGGVKRSHKVPHSRDVLLYGLFSLPCPCLFFFLFCLYVFFTRLLNINSICIYIYILAICWCIYIVGYSSAMARKGGMSKMSALVQAHGTKVQLQKS